jgi:hypothetical protein
MSELSEDPPQVRPIAEVVMTRRSEPELVGRVTLLESEYR